MNSTPQNQRRFRMQAWSDAGELLVDLEIEDGAMSLAGDNHQADHHYNFLGDNHSVLILKDEKKISLLWENNNTGERTEHFLSPGNPIRCAGVSWLIIKDQLNQIDDNDLNLLSEFKSDESHAIWPSLFEWLSVPMNNPSDLRNALCSFLSIVMDHSDAQCGILISRESSGQSLIANFGITTEEATRMWDKMPDRLFEDIIENQAHCIMPEGLNSSASSKSTIFVRHARSLVGFPILSEGRVIAILFLGFQNILRDLSPELQTTLERTCQFAGLVLHRAMLRSELKHIRLMGDEKEINIPKGRLIIGSSSEIRAVYNIISKLAVVNVPTLILGETGTGKELAARELHRMSDRMNQPFIAVNAAAVPESLFESQLFGHKKGAFTGALSDHKGLMEQADKGSLFIDEIGELPLNLQSKLLRVLQEKAIHRVGESNPRPVDFRLICATHQNLSQLVEDGRFREDLYYRVAGAVIQMPRLKDRPSDIVELANFFKERFILQHNLPQKEWTADALQALQSSEWKGNVRELEHTVNRAIVMAEGLTIEPQDLDLGQKAPAPLKTAIPGAHAIGDLTSARNQWLKAYIKEALAQNDNNRVKTAKVLGIGQRTLFRYIDQLGL